MAGPASKEPSLLGGLLLWCAGPVGYPVLVGNARRAQWVSGQQLALGASAWPSPFLPSFLPTSLALTVLQAFADAVFQPECFSLLSVQTLLSFSAQVKSCFP